MSPHEKPERLTELAYGDQAPSEWGLKPGFVHVTDRPADLDSALGPTHFPHRQVVRRVRSLRERIAPLAITLGALDLLCLAVLVTASGVDRRVTAALAGGLVLSRWSQRLYRPRVLISWLDDLPRSLASLAMVSGACAVVFSLAGVNVVADPVFVRAVAGFAVLNELLRMVCMATFRQARRRLAVGERTLILGAGVVGRALADAMTEWPEMGLRPVGFIDADPQHDLDVEVPVLSRMPSELADVIRQHRVGTVVVSFALTREAALVDTVITAHQMDCTVLVVPRMYELQQDGPGVDRLRGYPLVRLNADPTSRPSWWFKRLLDLTLAAVALLVVSPVLAVAFVAVLIESGRPLLFHQTRVGLDSKPFRIHKIRSLRPESPEEEQTRWSIATDRRVGAVGRLLRKTSIDELPQLWNILCGQMSFVGPRPERPGFVELFSIQHERYWARHRVPVGLTGLAQVNGLRGDTSIADRARFDNYYIANWSLWLDLRILVLTVKEVVRGSGA